MRPNYSQSSHENAAPSSGTYPLASYEEVPPSSHPPGRANRKRGRLMYIAKRHKDAIMRIV